MVTVGDVVYEVLTSGPLSSWVPDCLSSFLKEFKAPRCAVMLSSQLAILVQGCGETSRPIGQLSRRFLPDRMLDQWLHGRKSRERSLCPFHLAFKVANHSNGGAVVNYCSWISLFRVSTLVQNRVVPSFFFTRTVGLLHALLLSWMMPMANMSSTSCRSSSRRAAG